MVSVRFPSLLLGFLLVFQTLISSHADQGRRMKWNSLSANKGNIASVQKGELVAGISDTDDQVGKGGRKMKVMEKGLKKKEEGQRNGESITSKKTTGKDKNASMESLQGPHDLLNSQNNEKGLDETRTLESQSLNNTNPQSKRGLSTEASLELEGSSKSNNRQEWQRLLEEANEKVMQLMRKDYGGMRKPGRKPPVNNNEPND